MSYESEAVEEALEIVVSAAPLEFQIGHQRISLKQRWLYFREYTGAHPTNPLDKPIVAGPDRPFAELQAVKRLEHQGWTASWLCGPREFISVWEPREEAQPSCTARELVARINSRAPGDASRWDVFAWKPELRFIHMMRQKCFRRRSYFGSKRRLLRVCRPPLLRFGAGLVEQSTGGCCGSQTTPMIVSTGGSNARMAISPIVTVSGKKAWWSTIGTGVPRLRRTYSGWCLCTIAKRLRGAELTKKNASWSKAHSPLGRVLINRDW